MANNNSNPVSVHLRFWLLSLIFLAPLCAQTTVPEALEKAKSDLATALSSLDATRGKIASEKPALSADFEKIELELRAKRRLVRIARQSVRDRAEELRQLRADLSTRTEDSSYISGLLRDSALKNSTLAIPGSPLLDHSASGSLTPLDASLDRLEDLLGGSFSPGQAIDPSGNIIPGTFAALGPASYFLSEDKSAGGDVTLSKTASTPRFHPGSEEKIAALISGKQTTLQFDPTGGDARILSEIHGGPLDLIRKGGLWIWPIMFLALLSLVFGFIKLAQFARLREPTDSWINAILAALRNGDREKAQELASAQQHPAGVVMDKLVSISENSADLVEETLYEQLMSVQAKATSLLPVIAITAATAPLLGLLGTVSGMITTFNLITLFGSGDPKPLAGGISEALITTLFGLVVAIPALILHAFLSRRAQGIVQTTERLGLSFVNGLRAK